MRRRITRTLFAAAAAGVAISTLGFTAAGAASAAVTSTARLSTPPPLGPTIPSLSAAGYETSGRNFRYIQALITVPDFPSNVLFPQAYIQLSNGSLASGDQETRAGIESCVVARSQDPSVSCFLGEWVAYLEAFNNSIITPFFIHFVPLTVSPGDGVFFSIYFDQAGNELHYVVQPPGSAPLGFKTQAYGPLFDHAAALDDFTNSTGTPVPIPLNREQFRINQFFQGALTTYIGDRGSFVGPWTTSMVEATSNGLPFPQGHVRVSPGPLWSDGSVANGAVRSFDAFGVWARV